ncbi:hypothetical protein ONZ45_g10408 [Pleurotus djamor]|nr:hypothetical protein ONZ45_g10408 [Pleurotus djamor]
MSVKTGVSTVTVCAFSPSIPPFSPPLPRPCPPDPLPLSAFYPLHPSPLFSVVLSSLNANLTLLTFQPGKTTGKRKGDSRFVVTLNTTANHRANSECRGPNRCSSTSEDIRGEWSVNPTADLSCDEQPKNTNNEGGAGAATRCMPASENSHEGSLWGGYIKKNNLVDGDLVTVALALSSFAFFYPSPF